ncbi:MAG: methyltransferase [Pseudomonadota bacterium]
MSRLPFESARFWNKIAEKYAAKPVKDEAAYKQTLDLTRARLNADDVVLELGAGTGTTAFKLAPNVARYTASDIAENMMAIGQRKAEAAGAENVSFVTAGVGDAALGAPGAYDAVIAFSLLHLIDGLEEAVRGIADLIKPGGYFISKSVCLNDKPGVYGIIIPIMRFFGQAPFVRFLKASELEDIIADAGFEILETGDYPESPRNHFVVARKK